MRDGSIISNSGIEFSVSNKSIQEDRSDNQRLWTRFVGVGDTYLDHKDSRVKGQTEICSLKDHLEKFDLSTVSGKPALATGTFYDVVQVHCEYQAFLKDIGQRFVWKWNKYYAKGNGLIFMDGWYRPLGQFYGVVETKLP